MPFLSVIYLIVNILNDLRASMIQQGFYCPETIHFQGRLLSLDTPLVMGVINVNDDSFYAGSSLIDAKSIATRALQMVSEGAAIIDLGAMSSRPGAKTIPANQEIERLKMACQAVRDQNQEILISIDTFRVEVLKALEDFQVNMVNDISGGVDNEEIWAWTAAQKIPYVLMHMKGTPETMQSQATYHDLVKEMFDYYVERLAGIMHSGIKDIILDPGIGFAKTREHNFLLLKHLHVFQMFELPLMIGVSRKSFIYKTLDIPVEEALNGTTAVHMYALSKGVKILRVHDVKAAVETIQLWQKIKNQ